MNNAWTIALGVWMGMALHTVFEDLTQYWVFDVLLVSIGVIVGFIMLIIWIMDR